MLSNNKYYTAAQLYWEKHKKWKSVASEMGLDPKIPKNVMTVRRYGVQYEESGGVFHFVIPPEQLVGGTNHEDTFISDICLGTELRRAPYNIKHAVVIRNGQSHESQRHLSAAMGGALLLRVLLRRGDSIAFAGGGGPLNTAQILKKDWADTPPPDISHSWSVTGHFGWHDSVPRSGDGVMSALRGSISGFRNGHLLNLSIFGGKDVPDYLEESKDAKKPWNTRPSIALAGIGSLQLNNLLYKMATSDDYAEYAGVTNHDGYSALKDLVLCLSNIPKRDISASPVGDIMCRFFLIKEVIRRKVAFHTQKLNRCIKKLNEHLATPTMNQIEDLAKHGAVIAVASGMEKKEAIRHVMTREKPWITHISTNLETAQWLHEERYPN